MKDNRFLDLALITQCTRTSDPAAAPRRFNALRMWIVAPPPVDALPSHPDPPEQNPPPNSVVHVQTLFTFSIFEVGIWVLSWGRSSGTLHPKCCKDPNRFVQCSCKTTVHKEVKPQISRNKDDSHCSEVRRSKPWGVYGPQAAGKLVG